MKDWESPDWDDNPEWTAEQFARAKQSSADLYEDFIAALVRPIIQGPKFYVWDTDTASDEGVRE